MREAIAEDVLAQVDALAFAGWVDAYTDVDALSLIGATWHNVVGEGVGRALDRLKGECRICGAEVSQGRCWGCGAA